MLIAHNHLTQKLYIANFVVINMTNYFVNNKQLQND